MLAEADQNLRQLITRKSKYLTLSYKGEEEGVHECPRVDFNR